MPLRRRIEDDGSARFLTFSCFENRHLLGPYWARTAVVEQISVTKQRYGFSLYAYCVMPNHVHLLIQPDQSKGNVSQIFSAIKIPTSKLILGRIGETGVLDSSDAGRAISKGRIWQRGGGYDRNIFTRIEFLEKANYIEMNPVKAGLALRPEDYEWCSAGSPLLGRDPWT